MKIITILLQLLNPKAYVYADLFVQLSDKYGFDPLLVASIAWKESRLRNGYCFRGSYGLMQIQLKGRSCRETEAEAKKRRLYDPRVNLTRGLELMRYWRRWGQGRSYHWLLHYNQGFGVCPRGGKRCAPRRRVPIQTGRVGEYAEKVLGIYRRLKGAEECLGKGKSPSICRKIITQKAGSGKRNKRTGPRDPLTT